MNVLVTCAGRRSHTIAAFKEAVRGRGLVFACDSSADAPALQEADDAFLVPLLGAPGYLDALLAICRERHVGLLVPTLEPELPLLAEARSRFRDAGTVALVSSAKVVATCYDKLETARFLATLNLPVPATWLSLEAANAALARGELRLPLVVKPRWGVGSIGLAFAEDDEELALCFRLAAKQVARSCFAEMSATDPERCVLIQECLGGVEFGLDIVNDLEGRHVCTFVKRKLRMRAGQTDRAVTVQDSRLEELGRTIGEGLGHVGVLDCDVLVTAAACHVIDLNPRIGGGYPFSHVAGANVPAALVAWAAGAEPEPSCFDCVPGVAAARSDSFVVTRRVADSAGAALLAAPDTRAGRSNGSRSGQPEASDED